MPGAGSVSLSVCLVDGREGVADDTQVSQRPQGGRRREEEEVLSVVMMHADCGGRIVNMGYLITATAKLPLSFTAKRTDEPPLIKRGRVVVVAGWWVDRQVKKGHLTSTPRSFHFISCGVTRETSAVCSVVYSLYGSRSREQGVIVVSLLRWIAARFFLPFCL